MEPREADSEGEAKDHKRQAQYGVEGCAPHSRSLCCHTVGRRRGKKANLHLQTSQQQTRGHADRPDAQTVAKATRYPNGDNRGEAVRTTDQHHQTLRGRGARGEGSRKEHQTNQDNQQDQTQKQTYQQRGARASPPDHEATKHTRDATTTKQKTTETNYRSNRERKTPRDQTKGEPPRETVPRYNKHEFRHGRWTSRLPQRETRH